MRFFFRIFGQRQVKGVDERSLTTVVNDIIALAQKSQGSIDSKRRSYKSMGGDDYRGLELRELGNFCINAIARLEHLQEEYKAELRQVESESPKERRERLSKHWVTKRNGITVYRP